MGSADVNGITTGNSELDPLLTDWFKWNKNEEDNKIVKDLLASKDINSLSKMFLKRIEFGTAGLRGRMGPGFSQMNDLVIIQTAQGLLKYLQNTYPDLKQRGIVVGYDGRHNSKKWAEITAGIFQQANVRVNLFGSVCPTPLVPFIVTHSHHVAGVMVTASHNPKEDNGYKVYGDRGIQIISPVDKEIQKSILSNLEPHIVWKEPTTTEISPSIIPPTDEGIHKNILDSLEPHYTWGEVELSQETRDQTDINRGLDEYYKVLAQGVWNKTANEESDIKITYTAMHGVGYPYITRAFEVAGFKPVIPVAEQVTPDPDFPTVKFPNPEEGRSALDLAIKTANTHGSSLIIANDPDADRLAVAEKTRQGDWKVFTGNELGALLGWWSLFTYKKKKLEQGEDADLSNVYMLSSTVSSKILKTMAKHELFNFEETLTGFKWMGSRAADLQAQGKTVLYAFEESIGFMCGTAVLDKDGITAGVRAAELLTFLHHNSGLSLSEKLNKLYGIYGYHITENSYFICHDPEVIKKMFTRLRNYNDAPNTYPNLLKNKYEVTSIRDLTTGYDSSMEDKKAKLPVSSSSQMITFTFSNGLVTTLRTSGTEPKIKYYTEFCAPPEVKDIDEVKATLRDMVNAIIDEWFQPKVNNLIARSD